MGETLKRFIRTLKVYPRAVVILHWGDGLGEDEDGAARECLSYWSGWIAAILADNGIPTLDWSRITAGWELAEHCHLKFKEELVPKLGMLLRLLVTHVGTPRPSGLEPSGSPGRG
jgi:hypothetical protein